MASDHLLTGGFSGNIIDRGDGIVLLCLLIFYLYLAFMSAAKEKAPEPDLSSLEEDLDKSKSKRATITLLLSIAKVIGGLAQMCIRDSPHIPTSTTGNKQHSHGAFARTAP